MDMETIMAQAQALQDNVSKAQDSLSQMHVKGISGDGACIIGLTGKYDLTDVVISDDAASRGASYVSQLVASAYRDAKAKADTLIDQVMGEATAGIKIPE